MREEGTCDRKEGRGREGMKRKGRGSEKEERGREDGREERGMKEETMKCITRQD